MKKKFQSNFRTLCLNSSNFRLFN